MAFTWIPLKTPAPRSQLFIILSRLLAYFPYFDTVWVSISLQPAAWPNGLEAFTR